MSEKLVEVRKCAECEKDLPADTPANVTVHAGCAAAFCAKCGIFLFDTVNECSELCDYCQAQKIYDDFNEENPIEDD